MVIVSSNLKLETLCLDFTAAATLQVLATLNNRGDLQGDSTTVVVESSQRRLGDARDKVLNFIKSIKAISRRRQGQRDNLLVLLLLFCFLLFLFTGAGKIRYSCFFVVIVGHYTYKTLHLPPYTSPHV